MALRVGFAVLGAGLLSRCLVPSLSYYAFVVLFFMQRGLMILFEGFSLKCVVFFVHC